MNSIDRPRHLRASRFPLGARIAAGVTATLTVVAVAIGVPLAAQGEGSAHVTLHVYTTNGTPINIAGAYFLQVNPGDWPASQAYTTWNDPTGSPATGVYTYDVPPATYTAEFSLAGNVPQQYLGGTTDIQQAKLTTLVDGPNELSVSLHTDSTLKGKIQSPTGGTAKGWVSLMRYDGHQWQQGIQNALPSVQLDSHGGYSFTDLDPGSYAVRFDSSAGDTTYSGGVLLQSQTKGAWVGLGATVTAPTFRTVKGGTVTGKIQYLDGAGHRHAANGALVSLKGLTFSGSDATGIDPALFGFAVTNSSGSYSVSGVLPGTYVADYTSGDVATPWYGFASTSGLSGDWDDPATKQVAVTAGHTASFGTTTVPLESYPESTVTFQVTEPGPIAYPGAQVVLAPAYQQAPPEFAPSEYWAADLTDITGTAAVDGVPPGTYEYEIIPADGDETLYDVTFGQVVVTDSGAALVSKTMDTVTSVGVSLSLTCISGDGDCVSTPHVGDTLGATNIVVTPAAAVDLAAFDGLQFSWQWTRNGRPIYGAAGTSSSVQPYTLQPADLGAVIAVQYVAATSVGFGSGYYQNHASVAPIAGAPVAQGPAVTKQSDPAIVGPDGSELAIDAHIGVGTVLTANSGGWDPVATSTALEWVSCPSPIEAPFDYVSEGCQPLSSAPTYTVTAADADSGNPIQLIVTPTAPGYGAYAGQRAGSVDVLPVPHAAPTLKKAPKLGTPTTVTGGKKYTVSNSGTWSTTGLHYHYEWYVDGAFQSGNDSASFTSASTGQIAVVVYASKTGWQTGQANPLFGQKGSEIEADLGGVDTAPYVTDHALVATDPSPTVDEDSDVPVLDTLTVTPPVIHGFTGSNAWNGFGTTVAYEWDRSTDGGSTWSRISGATGASYTLKATDVGAEFRVQPILTSQSSRTTYLPFYSAGTAVPRLDLGAHGSQAWAFTTTTMAVGKPVTIKQSGSFGLSSVTVAYQWFHCAVTGPDAPCLTTVGDAGWEAIPHATKASYTPVAGDIGDELGVQVQASKAGYQPVGYTYAYLPDLDNVAVLAAPDKVRLSGTPAITGGLDSDGLATMGVQMKATPAKPDSGATVGYQWYFSTTAPVGVRPSIDTTDPAHPVLGSDWTSISGATSSTFTAVDSALWNDGNTKFAVLETAKKTGLVTAAAATIPAPLGWTGTPKPITKPAFTKTVAGGVTSYTVTTGTWVGFNAATSQRDVVEFWINGTPYFYDTWAFSPSGIGHDGTSATFRSDGPHPAIGPNDAVWATVSVDEPGYANPQYVVIIQKGKFFTQPSPPTSSVAAPWDITGPWTVASIDPSAIWTVPAGLSVTPTYQWYVRSSSHASWVKATGAGSKSATYVPRASDAGKQLSVVLTAAAPYLTTATYRFGTMTMQVDPSTSVHPSASPSGTWGWAPFTGNTLHPNVAFYTGIGGGLVPGGKVAYQWQQLADDGSACSASTGWKNISGATKDSYTVPLSLLGKCLRVVATGTAAGYAKASYQLSAGVIVAAPVLVAVAAPLVPDTAQVDVPVTATAPGWNLPGVTATYQWQRNGVDIPGATGATFTPVAEQAGDALSVRATGSKPGFSSVSTISAAVVIAKGAAPTSIASKLPVITGELVPDEHGPSHEVVTATSGGWSVGGLTFTYEWMYYNGSDWVDIPSTDGAGATVDLSTLADTSWEFPYVQIRVMVEAHGDGYQDGAPATSAPVYPFQ